MSAPAMILSAGKVLVTQSTGTLGIIIPTTSPVKAQLGAVVAVSDVTDRFSEGDSIMFDPSKVQQLMYGSTIYYLANEQDISGIETPLP
jgi:co-chaperonin GroES (HSP10)